MEKQRTFFRDETGRLRTAWRLTIAWAGVILIHIIVAVAAVVVLVIIHLPGGGDAASFAKILQEKEKVITYAVTFPYAALLVGFLMLLRRYLDRRPVRSMGLGRPERRPSSSVGVGLGLGLALAVAPALPLWACGALRWKGFPGCWEPAVLIPVLAVAAFTEEIVCRGYSYQNFLDIRRPVVGLFATALLFWAMHAFNPQVWSSPIPAVNLFAAGVLLALAYRMSGNIWFPTALHFGWNFAQGGVLGLAISGREVAGLVRLAPNPAVPPWLSGGAFGLEGSIVSILAQAALIALFLWILHRRKASERNENAGINPPPTAPLTCSDTSTDSSPPSAKETRHEVL